MNDSTWTWIAGTNSTNQRGIYVAKGVASVDFYPGARVRPTGWYDSLSEEFWLFGGYGYGSNSSQGA